MNSWILLAATLLTGCGLTGNSNYPPTDLDPAFTECAAPTDCVVVELGCCDECNGGLAVAVNRSSSAEVERDFSETCGNGTACTEIGCPEWVVTCEDGTCAAARGSFE